MQKGYPIGVDDFKKIIENNLYFVDKTMFIREVIEDSAEVTLITRPRRFGKTLNMSMLKYYFEKTEKSQAHLFEGLAISKQGQYYQEQQGKYPVIYLTFKDVKTTNWETSYELITKIITEEYIRHSYVLKSDVIEYAEKRSFEEICHQKGSKVEYAKSLEFLSRVLFRYYNEKVMILIDEYDTLLNEAHIKGYWEDTVSFMRVFLSAGFKNNIFLHKGILTGIFRVAKESIFSDMNNLSVSTILNDDYCEKFGFTEEEVKEIVRYYGIEEKLEKIADWYNGYLFGKKKEKVIYNPWSIMMYVKNISLEPYWINTSGNEMIKKISINAGRNVQKKIQDILHNGIVKDIKINENVIYNEIMNSEENIWSFLLMSGYLKVIKKDRREDGLYRDVG